MNTGKHTTDHENSFNGLSQDWLFDEKSECKAVPAYWVLSEPTSNNGCPQHETSDQPNTTGSSSTLQSDLRTAQHDSSGADDGPPEGYRNPFPEPRTFPFYWEPFK